MNDMSDSMLRRIMRIIRERNEARQRAEHLAQRLELAEAQLENLRQSIRHLAEQEGTQR